MNEKNLTIDQIQTLFFKRLKVMRELLDRIADLRDIDDIEKFSNLIGGLCVFFQTELGDEL
jgi:hypothetical protein